jgi:Bacterial SH3 domain
MTDPTGPLQRPFAPFTQALALARAGLVRLLLAGVALAGLALAALPAHAADEAPAAERLKVTDPFLELRTGPGRGYPVFHVAARDAFVQIELRHTDWYKVRTDDGKIGWVHRTQLETTLTDAGVRKGFRDVLLDDYLARRLEMGGGFGRFKGEPMLKLWTGYRLSDTLGLEGTVGQVQGLFSGTNFWHLNLHNEPWSDRRLSPFFGLGFGQFRNIPNASLVGAITTNARLANAMIGARYHVSDRFVVRLDYAIYTAFVADTRSLEYRAVGAGLSFFF